MKEGGLIAYTGELGAGKTATAVEDGFYHLAAGGTWFHNLELFVEEGSSCGEEVCPPGESVRSRLAAMGLEFDPSRLVHFSGSSVREFYKQVHRGSAGNVVLVTLDEGHLDFGVEDNKGKKDPELLAFVTHCRKLDIFVALITQDANELEIKIRRRLTVEVNCRNMKQERVLGTIPFPFPFYVAVRFKCHGGKIVRKLDNGSFKLRMWAWGMYASKAFHGAHAVEYGGMPIAQQGKLKRIQVKRSSILPALVAACIIIVCVAR